MRWNLTDVFWYFVYKKKIIYINIAVTNTRKEVVCEENGVNGRKYFDRVKNK